MSCFHFKENNSGHLFAQGITGNHRLNEWSWKWLKNSIKDRLSILLIKAREKTKN